MKVWGPLVLIVDTALAASVACAAVTSASLTAEAIHVPRVMVVHRSRHALARPNQHQGLRWGAASINVTNDTIMASSVTARATIAADLTGGSALPRPKLFATLHRAKPAFRHRRQHVSQRWGAAEFVTQSGKDTTLAGSAVATASISAALATPVDSYPWRRHFARFRSKPHQRARVRLAPTEITWGAVVDDTTFVEQVKGPALRIFGKARHARAWGPPAGSSIQLGSVVSATAAATGALSTNIACAAGVSCVAATAADLSTSANVLATSVNAVATAAATLSTEIPFASSVSAVVTDSANLSTAIPLAGSATGRATTAADLTATAIFAGSVSATASATGDLSTAITGATSATAQISVLAALSTAITPAASVAVVSATSADLSTAITPSANVNALAATSADLSTAITPSANVNGIVTALASLEGDITVVFGTAIALASLNTEIPMAASVSATASATLRGSTALVRRTNGPRTGSRRVQDE